MTRRVVFVLYPGVLSLDVSGPHDVFSIADTNLGGGAYALATAAETVGPVRADGGLALVADHALDDLGPGDLDLLVVPGGSAARDLGPEDAVVAAVGRLGGHVERTMSVCTGAFVLASAGLLRNRSAATHWCFAGELAERHPDVRVESAPLWCEEDSVFTSAGITAGIDLALHLVELDHGPDVARGVARDLVLHLRRAGGQSQYAAPVWADAAVSDESVRVVQRYVRSHPEANLGIGALAELVAMSPRHLQRVFRREVGMTLGQYVERTRVEAAQRCFETEAPGLDWVAYRCGFRSVETLRRSFRRQLGLTPGEYRERFGLGTSPMGGMA